MFLLWGKCSGKSAWATSFPNQVSFQRISAGPDLLIWTDQDRFYLCIHQSL